MQPEPLVRRASRHLQRSELSRAAAAVNELLSTRPDHLEGWVLRARLAAGQGDPAAAAQCWMRTDRVIAVKGKMTPFVDPANLHAAARHFVEVERERRAAIFLEALWRRFPASKWSAEGYLLAAEAAARARQWMALQQHCEHLARSSGSPAANERCAHLQRRAKRLRRIGPPAAPGSTRWRWEMPTLQGNTLNDVWTGPNGEAFTVGAKGTILHRRASGEPFRPVDSPTRWSLHGLSRGSREALYGVGAGGVVLRYEGGGWRIVREPRVEQADLHAVCVNAKTRMVYAVGEWGTVVRLSPAPGTADVVRPESDSAPRARRVAGTGSRIDVDVERPATQDLYDVWCATSGEVLAVGDEGTVVRLSGGGWQRLQSDSFEQLRGVTGFSDGRVVAVGARRTLVQLHGGRAKEHVIGSGGYHDLWSGGRSQSWIVGQGGRIFRAGKDLTMRWRAERSATALELRAVTGQSPASMLAVGRGGTIVARRGPRWRLLAGGQNDDIIGLAVVGQRGAGVALSRRGVLWRRRGGRWRAKRLSVVGRYRGLWQSGQSGLAVGDQGLVVELRQGRATRLQLDADEDLHAVAGLGGGDFVAVGDRGLVVRRRLGVLQTVRVGGRHALRSVAAGLRGEIWAVGDRGTIMRYGPGGGRWRAMSSPVVGRLNAVWAGSKRVVAVGDGGTVLRYQRGRWRVERSPTGQDLVAIWGTQAGELFAVSGRGTILRFDGLRLDGTPWRVERSPASCLAAVHGSATSGEVLAAGCHGTVLRRETATP